MFPRHYVAFCPRCNEVTPHEDHSFGRRLSIVFGIVGLVLVFLPDALDLGPWVGGACLLIAIVVAFRSGTWFSFDRHERFVKQRCTRCRHKAVLANRRTKPDPRNSTIDI